MMGEGPRVRVQVTDDTRGLTCSYSRSLGRPTGLSLLVLGVQPKLLLVENVKWRS